MKKLKLFILGLMLFLITDFCNAQQNSADYKGQNIDNTGNIKDSNGNVIGNIDEKGVVFDDKKIKLGSIDANGVVKDKNGKVVGKSLKNGTFTNMAGEIEVTVSEKNKECEILDGKGKKIGITNINYKSQACVVHCFFMNKKKN